tara:strand:+ start:255 stop:743 length:489 start_codon:yes stop_codon:yes gene_type:complete
MKLLNNFFFDFVLVVSIFFLDRISKIYVINFSQNNLNNNILNSKYLDLTLIWNEGIAFGLMSFDNNHYYNILTGIIIIITLIVLIIGLKNKGLKRYSLLSIFAGSLGNLYDRLFYNAVPDFIDFHVNNFHWFIFNVADIFISFGVIIMIMTEFFVKKGELDA